MSGRGPTQLFAHGAGAGSAHPWMRGWAERLRALGPVTTFDYPYMAAGKRRPDPLPALLAAHDAALDEALGAHGSPVVLVGKSMGSRVGCHLSLSREVAAVVCLGYPLVAPSGGKMRDEVLVALAVPVLFVQGTRDPLCPLDRLDEVRARMRAQSALHVVTEGDHSLTITKRHTKATGQTQEGADRAVLDAVAAFYGENVART